MSDLPPAPSAPPDLTATGPIPEISVIIVSWNAYKFLEECLDSLSRGITRSYEVIVVDNASKDGSEAMVRKKFPSVQLIQSGSNLGFAKGNNLAFAHARGRYVCLINSDVNVFPGCVDTLAQYLDQHQDVGMVGPRILNADRSIQNSCREFPSLWNKLCTVSNLSRLFPASPWFSGDEMHWFDHKTERPVDALVGCFIMTRRKAVDDFGLLDENFFMYGEDIDWGYRCRKAKWRVIFYPGTESIHYRGASSNNDPIRFTIELQRASFQLWAKHRSWLARGLYWCLVFIHTALRTGQELATACLHRRWTPDNRLRYEARKTSLFALFSLNSKDAKR